MIVKLLSEHHLKFLSLTGGCRGSSESTLVKMPNCWKSHVTAESAGATITYRVNHKIAILLSILRKCSGQTIKWASTQTRNVTNT